jgi:dolichol-phosphate mannosyltransferase
MSGRRANPLARGVVLTARLAAAGVALARLARAARREPSLAPPTEDVAATSISVVVPARDEAARLGTLLAEIVGAPGVREVIVVDDESSDATAAIAAAAGAVVVAGGPLPPGWAGKAWALQQGIERASGDWVVTLDADTRPDPRLALAVVERAERDQLDVVTVAGRFECPTAGARLLHPAMLTTLVYRFGPPGPRPAGRMLANGQCMAMRRRPFVAVGAMSLVAGHTVEDVALVRVLADRGWRVGFVDGTSLLAVRMYEDFADTWRGWGRSLALPGVEPVVRQALDAMVVALAQVLPLPRLVTCRGDVVDVALVVARLGTLVGTARAYTHRGVAYWCSPLADSVALAGLVSGVLSRRQRWRGRDYATLRPRSARR